MSTKQEPQPNLFPHMSIPVIDKENSSELMTIDSIENSPLKIVGSESKGYWIALGRYRVTEIQKTKDDAVNLLLTDNWNITINIIILICDEIIQNHKKHESI